MLCVYKYSIIYIMCIFISRCISSVVGTQIPALVSSHHNFPPRVFPVESVQRFYYKKHKGAPPKTEKCIGVIMRPR